MKRFRRSLFLAMLIVAAGFSTAHAVSSYMTSFRSTYPAAKGSAIDNCTLCHPGGNTASLNSYANAYASAGHAYAPIANLDSDGDGFTNAAEITAFTYPGDATSKPTTPPANKPPVANAGSNQSVTSGATVTLNGSASSDSDGTIAKYLWAQTAGTPTVPLSSTSAASPTFTAPTVTSAATLTFTLTVTDNGGLTASASCTVTVNPGTPPANKPPVANAGSNQSVTSGATVTLNGSASSDSDGTIAKYLWAQTAGTPTVTLSSTSAASPTFTAPTVTSAATLTFSLTVTDNGGLTASASCTVTVNPGTPPANKPPTANAGASQTVASGVKVTLSGAASTDPDGTIASYAWTQTAGTAVTLSGATTVTASFTAPKVTARTTLTFSLIVTDNSGTKSAPATVNVIVNPGTATRPPVANAGLDQSVLPGSINTLDGSGSTDPDDGIASYLWTQTAGPAVKLSDPSAMDPVFQAPWSAATLGFSLVVTDKSGQQSSDVVSVVVLAPDGPPQPPPANKPPVANAGADQSVRSGSTVRLTGSASKDPDDGIASYRWQQTAGTAVTLTGANTVNASFRAPAAGSSGATLTFQLTVTDNAGSSTTDSVTVRVSGTHDDDD